jgi:hypothetical protein
MGTALDDTIAQQRATGFKGEHWNNYAVARYTVEGELNHSEQAPQNAYNLSQKEFDTLLVNSRRDAAHALCNTRSLLELNRKVRANYGRLTFFWP